MFYNTHRYRSCKGHGLNDRFREAFREHERRTNNHNTDTTGGEGEAPYLWTALYEEYLQWKDSHSTSNQAQQSRQAMRTVQNALGAVQPPLGTGNPTPRSEVAAENGPAVGGPQELGETMEVRQVTNPSQSTVQRPPMQPRSVRGRRRAHVSSGTERSNRPRVDRGNTIQDHIAQGRVHLDTITNHLGVLTRSVASNNQPTVANPWSQDPVGNARQLTDSMITIASGLGSPQAREARQRALHFMNGIMNQAATTMGFDMFGNTNGAASHSTDSTPTSDDDSDIVS